MRDGKGLIGVLGLILAVALSGCSESSSKFELFKTARADGKVAASKAPLSKFLDIKAPVGGQLSPDGTLYYVNRAGAAYQLFRMPASPDSIAKQLTDFEDGVAGFNLSPNGKNVVIAASVGGDEQNDLYMMRTRTFEIKPLMVDRGVVYGSVLWKRDNGSESTPTVDDTGDHTAARMSAWIGCDTVDDPWDGTPQTSTAGHPGRGRQP